MHNLRIVFLACLVLAAWTTGTVAQPNPVPGIPIEGVLVQGGWYMEGVSDNWGWLPPSIGEADVSPDGGYWVHNHPILHQWPDVGDLYRSDFDGSNPINLTPALGGTNCLAHWSPDGSEIVFQHSWVPYWGYEDGDGVHYPCEAWEVWLVDADGLSDPEPLRDTGAEGQPILAGYYASFAPNGYSIVYVAPDGATLIDTDGTDKRTIMGPGHTVGWGSHPTWKRDGSGLVCTTSEPDFQGEWGVWRQVTTVDADGENPQVIFERFMPDSVTDGNMNFWGGPAYPRYSPSGDEIVFTGIAILGTEGHDLYLPWYDEVTPDPWDMLGALQTELYLIDAEGVGSPIRLTADDFSERNCSSWAGPNTFPDDPEVTVDNTTVTFSDVTDEGVTTILRDDDPPALPGGYQFCGEYYDVSTTATVAGPITICMTYKDEDVPGGNEEALCLLHYDEAIPGYEDITISRDAVNNIVCGQVDSLSVFGLASMPIFGGFRPPINPDGSSVWKAGRTIPVKFALTDSLGNLITDAACHLSTWQVSSEILGSVPEAAEAVYADAGDTFRYCPEEQQYIYNLSTKGMATGTWMLRVTADGWPGFEATVMIGLR